MSVSCSLASSLPQLNILPHLIILHITSCNSIWVMCRETSEVPSGTSQQADTACALEPVNAESVRPVAQLVTAYANTTSISRYAG